MVNTQYNIEIYECTVSPNDQEIIKGITKSYLEDFFLDNLTVIIIEDNLLHPTIESLLKKPVSRIYSGACALLFLNDEKYRSAIFLPFSEIADISKSQEKLEKFISTFSEEFFHVMNYNHFLKLHGFHAYDIQFDDKCKTHFMILTFKILDEYLAISKKIEYLDAQAYYPNLIELLNDATNQISIIVDEIKKTQNYPQIDLPQIIFNKILDPLVRNEALTTLKKNLLNETDVNPTFRGGYRQKGRILE